MALPSQELLEKYRAEEKADKGTPANPKQTNAETTEPKTDTQPTGSEAGNGEGGAHDGEPSGQGAENGAGEPATKGDDRWHHTQAQFEKRLNRQERSHRKQVSALEAEIAELKKQLASGKPELKREDFPTAEAYESFKNEELKKQILAENDKKQAELAEAQRQKEEADKKVEATFKTPEAQKEFRETVNDFIEDNSEWLESEEGQLYQEIIDQSPVGLVMAMAIAKNDDVIAQMKHWSKDMLFLKLSQFETSLLSQAKKQPTQPQQTEPNAPKKTTSPQPSTSGIPSTGSVGKTQAPQTFNAKDWLRKNRPERYSH